MGVIGEGGGGVVLEGPFLGQQLQRDPCMAQVKYQYERVSNVNTAQSKKQRARVKYLDNPIAARYMQWSHSARRWVHLGRVVVLSI